MTSDPRRRARLPRHPRRIGAGFTLLEACLAFGVLAFGLLAMGQLQASREGMLEAARERGQAVRLAQTELERLRLQAALEPAPRATAPQGHGSVSGHAGASVIGTREAVVRVELTPDPSLRHHAVRVIVSWRDRQGREQSVSLDTLIAAVAP